MGDTSEIVIAQDAYIVERVHVEVTILHDCTEGSFHVEKNSKDELHSIVSPIDLVNEIVDDLVG